MITSQNERQLLCRDPSSLCTADEDKRSTKRKPLSWSCKRENDRLAKKVIDADAVGRRVVVFRLRRDSGTVVARR
jgi:hypothetical protein